MAKRTPIDALSALVMTANAVSDDMIYVRRPNWRTPLAFCVRHLEDIAHRKRHRDDAKHYAPAYLDRLIARDDLVEQVRKSLLLVYAIERRNDNNWHQCKHCRFNAKSKHDYG